MIDFYRLRNVLLQWPVSVLAIGVILTIVWIVMIFWLPVWILLSA